MTSRFLHTTYISGLKHVVNTKHSTRCSLLLVHQLPDSRHISVQAGGLRTSSEDQRSKDVNAKKKILLPTEARVVIAGGGVLGCSVGYHLAKMGVKDVVILEQGSLTCGTTWHAAGLACCLQISLAELSIYNQSLKLFNYLHNQGHDIGWRQVGSLNLCRTEDRLVSYKRSLLYAQRFGVEGELLSPEEIKKRAPLLNTDDLKGGVLLPNDGLVNPSRFTLTLARLFKEMGGQVIEGCQVQRVLTANERVDAVQTNRGTIKCDMFVNCAGQWARHVGQLSSPPVRVPLHPCEHFYLLTKPIDGVQPNMPTVRDYDGRIYLREWNGGVLGGGFEEKAKAVFLHRVPDNFQFRLFPEDWDHFQPLLEQLIRRFPALAETEALQLVCGAEAFTPDAKYILGKAQELKNYFVAAGMNGSGVAASGGIGYYLAEWMINGHSSVNMWKLNIQRFVDLHNNRQFLQERVTEIVGKVADIAYWESETAGYTTGRKLRTSAIFSRNEPYAVFGQYMGYERPLYFHHESHLDDDLESQWSMSNMQLSRSNNMHDILPGEPSKIVSFGKPSWFENVKSEYWACREGVCLIDMSTFAKLEISSAGPEVVNFLQYVCSNDIDKAVGYVMHTGIQNENGGYENDCSVVRLSENKYFLVSPTVQQTRGYAWLHEHLPADGSVNLNDVTSMYTALNVIVQKHRNFYRN